MHKYINWNFEKQPLLLQRNLYAPNDSTSYIMRLWCFIPTYSCLHTVFEYWEEWRGSGNRAVSNKVWTLHTAQHLVTPCVCPRVHSVAVTWVQERELCHVAVSFQLFRWSLAASANTTCLLINHTNCRLGLKSDGVRQVDSGIV